MLEFGKQMLNAGITLIRERTTMGESPLESGVSTFLKYFSLQNILTGILIFIVLILMEFLAGWIVFLSVLF